MVWNGKTREDHGEMLAGLPVSIYIIKHRLSKGLKAQTSDTNPWYRTRSDIEVTLRLRCLPGHPISHEIAPSSRLFLRFWSWLLRAAVSSSDTALSWSRKSGCCSRACSQFLRSLKPGTPSFVCVLDNHSTIGRYLTSEVAKVCAAVVIVESIVAKVEQHSQLTNRLPAEV